MSRRLDVEPNSIAGRLMPATRIADDLLRTTFTQGGFPQALSRTASLVVVYGIRPDDAAILHLAAQDLIGGAEDDAWSVEAKVRDWTDLESQRPDYVQRLLNEASVATRTMIVLCRKRSEVPAVVATVADAVLPLADRKGAVEPFVEEIGKFLPDRALLDRLSALPLSYLNLVLRPGTSRERMWAIAGRLRRTVGPNGDAKPGMKGDRREKRVASTRQAPTTGDGHPERLEDMAGMGEAQRWGLALAADLARYRDGSLPWCDVENGAVLHGPPGTGKTLFARALAGSCGVPLLSHSFASWQAKGHLGDLLKALRAAFDEARKDAPCVLFIDELDSVGSRDEPLGDHASYQRQVVNGLLESLDGTVGRGGVVVIGATNALSAIDQAILRPGRLGRIVEVSFPDIEGRIGILRHHLRGDLAEVSLEGLAGDVGEASGAAIAEVVREARAMARREGRALREADLYDALPKGVLLSDSAFRRFCLHEAGHVIAGLELASLSGIVPTGATVRRRVRHGSEHRTNFDVIEGFDRSRESVEANVVVFLAGLAAEEVVLGSRGAGAGGTADADLVRATQLVAQAEFSWGLGDGLHSVTAADAAKAVSRLAAPPDVRDRIDRVLARCLQEARDIIERRRDDVERVAARLAETSEFTLPNPELGLA